jgi:hypothetical protein
MTKRALIKAAHLRNEHFLRELREIIELVPSMCAWQAIRIQTMSDEQMSDGESSNQTLRTEAALAKVLMDRLEALLEEWPNAVWLFFPETGATGWIRLLNEFHGKLFPTYFPGPPQRVMWRSKRVRGHRWCGVAPRIRNESIRTFRIWDQFKAGRKPVDIVRREFPRRSTENGRKSKKELMVVRRGLERASQLIYGQSLPSNRKVRRLQSFDQSNHMATCNQCRSAASFEHLCQTARDFLNQDYGCFLHNWTSI